MAGPGCSDDRVPCCDIDCDIMQIQLKDAIDGHEVLMEESRGNISVGHQVFRQAAGTKFRDVDPLEAAATEAILDGVKRND